MPCYNYSNNDPVYFDPNMGLWSVEKVYAAGATYSYDTIAILCEIPAQDQLCVYTRANSTAPETKLTLTLDYTVNTALKTIVLVNALGTGELVIRRCTPNTKMFIPFAEGAKLTAQQLNLSLHQLLFIAQEKEYVGSTINQFYPIAITASAWSGATSYVINNYVLSGGNIYRCIANHTNQVPPNATYWSLVNQASNGFVIDGGATISGPIKFNLNGVTLGSSLVWDGTQFQAGTISGQINNLSDVTITTPVSSGSILVWNGINAFENQLPSVNILANNLLFKSHVFVDESQSYTSDNTSISAPISLAKFKNAASKWNVTSIPTVWHVLNTLTPGYVSGSSSTYFDAFLQNVSTNIQAFSSAISNPVKVKLIWNLNKLRNNLIDSSTGDNLQDYRSTFWDKPQELYHTSMWTLVDNLKYHGVLTSTPTLYLQNAYFAKVAGTYYSKLTGYGIKNNGFYLSIPECYTTSLARIPIIQGTPTTWSNHVFTQSADITHAKLTSCDETTGIYRDLYLEGLRDMMSASTMVAQTGYTSNTTGGGSTPSAGVEEANRKSRYAKGLLLSADYNGLDNISYKRLETAESAKLCLFKIPKQIIYYNKAALACANSGSSLNTTDTPATWPNLAGDTTSSSILSKQTRFTGPGSLNYSTGNINSTTTNAGIGNLYKSDEVWTRWCNSWSTSPTESRFNEADIEWQVYGVVSGNGTSLNLFDNMNPPPIGSGNLVSGAVGYNGSIYAGKTYPWVYRSSYYDKINGYGDGYIGTHRFNVDMNKFFSESTNYLPDPRDEYVFRLVVKDNLFATFKKAGSVDIASSIILEHGFTDEQDNGLTTNTKTLATEIYQKNTVISNSHRARLRLNRNDIKVFIQNEHLESYDGDPTHLQYVINLCISVPRLKSIGYSRVYRQPLTNIITTVTSAGTSCATDIENDLGPWTTYFDGYLRYSYTSDGGVTWNNTYTANQPYFGAGIGSTTNFNLQTLGVQNAINGGGLAYIPWEYSAIGGRNECAVKFVRLGIPSDMWIRLSVLNTDASVSLLTSGGAWNI